MIRLISTSTYAGLLAVSSLLVLAACSKEEDPGPFCPASAIINGLDQIDSHEPGPQSTDTLRYSVSLTNIEGRCTYQGGTLTLRYSIDLVAQLGPALIDPDVAVSYFVTVIDDGGQVISKDLFGSSFELTPDAPIVRHRDQFQQVIEDANPEQGRFYSVFFGFQVDGEDALQRRRRNL